MLLLAALVATAAWSCGFAQNVPMQSPLSVTKPKGSVRLRCHFKDVSVNFDSTAIHWYQQKVNKAPVRMLYFSGSISVDDGFRANRYRIEKDSSQKLCTLTINDITPDDTATYYCAYPYWDTRVYSEYYKVFGTGTKLIVSDKGHIPPASSEILQKEHENMITYVCLIEKFYPDVIRVTWTDEESKEVTDNVVKGDTWSPKNDDRYSVSSWLTVPVENKDKNYNCKYEHESQQHSLPTQDYTKTAPPEEDCSANRGNSTVFNRDHLMHRTAYLVYIVLLLKSTMYYLIVLFFIYRMWAPTKHQGKTA
ncbi:PREDICTED: immunoglobulin lambda-like polypeptide 5 [Nipponia nippon]|uniref:immunoglobulin lambda-like polypeptide 5 n=1 Tax=Nipponia nippon TaxID=128390 RepID=UPI000510E84F|nr:PREDICTED: immunoglobulin lambda-like polypeptide 5 [Nipponia nippon]